MTAPHKTGFRDALAIALTPARAASVAATLGLMAGAQPLAAAPVGAPDAAQLDAIVAHCADPAFWDLSHAGRAFVLGGADWRTLRDDDRDWFVALMQQEEAAWLAYSDAVHDPAKAALIWAEAGRSSLRLWNAPHPEQRHHRGPQDALLRVDTAARDCLVFTGPGPAPAALYQRLDTVIERTRTSPLLEARMQTDIAATGGPTEANHLDQTALQALFGDDFDIAYIFLVTTAARPPEAAPQRDISN